MSERSEHLRDLVAKGKKEEFLEALAQVPQEQLAAELNSPSLTQEQVTVFHEVARSGWADIVPQLVRQGADPNIKTFYEVDALFLAVARNDLDTARALLQNGANVNTRKYGDDITVLQLAIEEKHIPMMELLLEYGASITERTPPAHKDISRGKNAFHYAARSLPEVMHILLQQPGAAEAVSVIAYDGRRNQSAFRIALETGNREMAEELIKFGVDVNETDDNGETPLFYLLAHRPNREEAMDLVRLLIRNGADVNKATNFWNESLLFPAVRESFTEAVRLLIDLGLDAKQVNQQGQTLLHLAAECWDVKIVNMLIGAGADIKALNRQKETPLHVAAHRNRLDVVKALLEAGADPFAKDQKGMTPRDHAPAEYQRLVHRELDRKEQEIEVKRDGYAAYWNRKAKEEEKKKPQPYRRPSRDSHGFRRGR